MVGVLFAGLGSCFKIFDGLTGARSDSVIRGGKRLISRSHRRVLNQIVTKERERERARNLLDFFSCLSGERHELVFIADVVGVLFVGLDSCFETFDGFTGARSGLS